VQVHPKLWFLRYVGNYESVTYRLLCLSRNMTFDRSWNTMLCLEGPLFVRVVSVDLLARLAESVYFHLAALTLKPPCVLGSHPPRTLAFPK
jgi:hypothetical protein